MYTTAADASKYVTFITLLYMLRKNKGGQQGTAEPRGEACGRRRRKQAGGKQKKKKKRRQKRTDGALGAEASRQTVCQKSINAKKGAN
jgi:hypothetical protein